MNQQFKEKIQELVHKSEGNQASAAKKMGVSTAFICQILRGNGPADPRTLTWVKLYKALKVEIPEYQMSREVMHSKFSSTPPENLRDQLLNELSYLLEEKPKYIQLVKSYIEFMKTQNTP